MQQDVAGSGVPLAGGRREFGVDVGAAVSDGAEFEGAAAADVAVAAEVGTEVVAHEAAEARAGGDDGRRLRHGATVQAGVAVFVVFVGAFVAQGVPVGAADRGINETEGGVAMLDAGDGDAELTAALDKFAGAVDGVYQPVVVRRVAVHGGIGFFAEAGQVKDVRQVANEEVVGGKVCFGERGVVVFDPDVVAVGVVVI